MEHNLAHLLVHRDRWTRGARFRLSAHPTLGDARFDQGKRRAADNPARIALDALLPLSFSCIILRILFGYRAAFSHADLPGFGS